MLKLIIVGDGEEAVRFFHLAKQFPSLVQIVGIVGNLSANVNFTAPEKDQVRTAPEINPFLRRNPDVIVDFTQKVVPTNPDKKLPLIISGDWVQKLWKHLSEKGLYDMGLDVPTTEQLAHLTQQVHDLEGMKDFFQAIINSFDDAISVVDADGRGFLFNPAYTRLTGLSPEQVIGQPAEVDIVEGESMHRKVLKTQKPVRGVQMRIGPNRKEVVVNVAPILVGNECKGSVGIIHDRSELERLSADLKRANKIIRHLEAKYTFEDIIGESEEIRLAIQQAKLAADTRATVLLRGESGTGKELFAHAIHNASQRKWGPFIRVNCAALVGTLLESELFGYEEGAFTGAKRGGKKGLFEEANGGTIFLDEIGEMDLSTQAKLLRVLQEKEIVRVGGSKVITVDVRVIAATHIALERAMEEGRFREDLYYRLNVFPIQIPPLRRRKEDLLELSQHLIQKLNREYGRSVQSLSAEASEALGTYDFPGNVRELENLLGRAMIQMKYTDQQIQKEHLSPFIPAQKRDDVGFGSLKEQLDRAEKEILLKALEENRYQKRIVAKKLQISLRTLYYKLEKHGISLQ